MTMSAEQAQAAIDALQAAVRTNETAIAQVRTESNRALDETRALALEYRTARADIMTALDETKLLAQTMNPMVGKLEDLDKKTAKAQATLETTQETLQKTMK